MIDLIISNEKALVLKSDVSRYYLDHYLTYTTSSCSKDIRASRKQGKTVYKWKVESHVYYDDGDIFYEIPRGIAEMLPEDVFHKVYEISEILEIPTDLDDEYIRYILKGVKLRDEQVDAVQKSLYYKRGVNQLATGAGKSIIICAILKILLEYNRDAKFLLILPYEHLQKSFSEYFERFGISYEFSSEMDGSKNVTISSSVSILNRSQYLPLYNGVIYDECQHIQSDTWIEVSKRLQNAEIALGFSAKAIEIKNIMQSRISKLSPSEALIIGATGKVITYVSTKYCVDQGILATPVVMSICNYLSESLVDEIDWHKSVSIGLYDECRMCTISEICRIFNDHGRRILILVSTIEQARVIAEWISGEGIDVGVSLGGNRGFLATKDNDHIVKVRGDEVIDKFKSNDLKIVIGTSHLDEGADFPDLDVCILAGAGKKSRRLIQKVGRSLRISKTGKFAYLIDFEDHNSKILHKHYLERVKTYVEDIGVTPDRMYKGLSVDKVESVFKRLENIE